MLSLVVIAALVAVALARPEVEVLVTGLNDPRFVTFANNRLYVSEGGSEAHNNTLTRTGSVKEISRESSDDDDDDDHKLRVRTLLTLDSYAESDEGALESNGPSGVAVHDGRLYVCSQSFDLAEMVRAGSVTPADAARELTFGKILAVDLSESDDDDSHERRTFTVGHPGQAGFDATTAASLLNVFGAWAQPEGPDTDPYGIYYDDRDDTIYVANAASNLLQAVKDGRTRTVAFFPATSLYNSTTLFTLVPAFSPTTGYASDVTEANYGGDATPTSVTRGPDGYLYVTTLEFSQSLNGPAANVYRIDPRAENHQVSSADIFASGFKMLTDIHYSKHHNSFFLVEQRVHGFADALGDVVRIDLGEHHHHSDDDDDHHELRAVTAGAVTRHGVGSLTLPNGVTSDDDGHIYVVDGATGAQTGRLVRVNI